MGIRDWALSEMVLVRFIVGIVMFLILMIIICVY